MSKKKKDKIDPNIDCQAGKLYKLSFKTGVHKDKKKEANKKACRGKDKKDLD